jgi:hypothetical protein
MAERWPALLTQEDACLYLSISATKFKEFKSLGLIRSVLVGSSRLVRYRRADLDQFVDELPDGSGQPVDARFRSLMSEV